MIPLMFPSIRTFLANLALVSTLTAAAAEPPAKLVGNYRLADGTIVAVGKQPEGPGFFLMRFADARLRALSFDGTETASGSYLLHGSDASLVVDGARLRLTDGTNREPQEGQRLPFRTETVRFASRGAKLVGTLWLPEAQGPHPVVVLVAGSGPETRDGMRAYPYFFLSRDIAVLTYDKRGSGESTGSWLPWESGIHALADDVVAGIEMLRQRQDVSPDRIGVMGFSNGAYVAVDVAARLADLRFVVLVSGGGVELWRTELFRLQNAIIEKCGDQKQARDADTFMRSLFVIARGQGGDTAKLGRLIDAARKKPWFSLTVLAPFADTRPKELLSLLRRAWTLELGVDVTDPLQRVRCNVLAIQGTEDRDVPSGATARALRRHLRRSASFKNVVLQGADHNLIVWKKDGGFDDYKYAAPLFDALVEGKG